MKKFWGGFGLGVLSTILLVVGWIAYNTVRFRRGTGVLDELARHDLEQAVPGVRVLDVAVNTEPESTAKVNYVHDHLYDVPVVYQKGSQVKSVTLTYGVTHGVWISPNTSEIVIADSNAPVIQFLGAGQKGKP